MKKTKHILSIDLGTSGPKVAIVSLHGKIIDYSFQNVPIKLLPKGGATQDPKQWWKTILTCAKVVISKQKVLAEDIVAISTTSQWSGTVAVDHQGNPLMEAIIWLDTRGKKYIEKITGGLFKISGYEIFKLMKWIKLTGGAPGSSGKDSLAHILFIKNELSSIYKKTYKFLEPKDYINLCFSGKMASSYETMALHWVTDNRHLEKVHYNDKLLKMASLEREKLPDLKGATSILGPIKKEVAKELGLKEDVSVMMGTPDMHSTIIGSGAYKDFQGHIYIGTSSWISTHLPYKKTDLLHNMASLPAALPNKYFLAAEQETAGASLTYLKDLLALPDKKNIYLELDQMALKVPPGSDKVIFTPWPGGERAPIENHTVRAAFSNLSLTTSREHLVRAVLEGVALNSRWLLTYVSKFIKRKMDSLTMVGGGANSELWCQIYADVLGVKIKQIEDPLLANLRGAALLASLGLKEISMNDLGRHVKIKKTYTPNLKVQKIYNQLYSEFINIYKKNQKIYHRLNGG